MKKQFKFLAVFLFIFALFSGYSSVCFADNIPAAKVTDLSGKKYEPALIRLLDQAKDSIVISMYYIGSCVGEKNPVRRLLNDLLEARQRGVKVTMYLNTCFALTNEGEGSFIGSPAFNELKNAGCDIYLVPSYRRLHDKLIIIDGRYVIVGSTNWSISALSRNFETSTLIDSELHAQEKLKHLEEVANFINSNSQITNTAYYLQEIPEDLSIADELMTNNKYFSRMVTSKDSRAFDLYLLLLARSQLTGEDEFYINLEDMGVSLGIPAVSGHTDLRRQVIKSLKKLQGRYHLLTLKFFHGKDGLVKLVNFPGKVFSIPANAVIQSQEPVYPTRLKFLLLIEALLKSEGKDLSAVAKVDLARRFNINKVTVHEAFGDLKTFKIGEKRNK